MINKIEAVNYRCLRNISQPLDRFHVIAGPNGSGKSTFLEIVRVLGAYASDGLDSLLHESRAQQLSELFFRGEGDNFQAAIELLVPDEVLDSLQRRNGDRKKHVRYEVEIGRNWEEREEPRILTENLWLIDRPTELSRQDVVQEEFKFPSRSKPQRDLIHGQNKTPTGWKKVAGKSNEKNAFFKSETSKWNFTLKPGKRRSALSNLPEDERFGVANWAKERLTRGVHKLMLRSEAMQCTCGPLKERTFKPDGSTLPLVIQELKEDTCRYQSWLAHVQTILPIREIGVIERPEDKNTYLQISYASGVCVPSWHLSDGTLRMLALTLLPYIKSDGVTYLIEEPENGVHPPAVEAIYKSLSSIYEGQALVATHSPVLVGLIEPKQLLCFSRTHEGETDIVRGDKHPRLSSWQEEFHLAHLFASGVLS